LLDLLDRREAEGAADSPSRTPGGVLHLERANSWNNVDDACSTRLLANENLLEPRPQHITPWFGVIEVVRQLRLLVLGMARARGCERWAAWRGARDEHAVCQAAAASKRQVAPRRGAEATYIPPDAKRGDRRHVLWHMKSALLCLVA